MAQTVLPLQDGELKDGSVSPDKQSGYTYDEVSEATLAYFHGDTLAANVWITKYCLKRMNDDGTVVYKEKSPEDMFERLAGEFHRAGLKYENPLSKEEILELLRGFDHIVPQGRPMAGIGNNEETRVSISNCFVVGHPDEDSYGSICRTDEELIQLFKRGGGCVWENTLVRTQGKGDIPIKDVEVGDYVLSFNTETRQDEWKRVRDKYPADVRREDQIAIRYENGTVLRTSKKHPVLFVWKEGYRYKAYNDPGPLLSFSYNKVPNSVMHRVSGSFRVTTEEYGRLKDGVAVMEEKAKEEETKEYKFGLKKEEYATYYAVSMALKYNIINCAEFDDMHSRVGVKSIDDDDDEKLEYIDIEVEDNNNYYAGSGDADPVNIHNCGTDLSHFRSAGSKVRNAAMSSTGPVDICATRFSNSAREVGQDGRRAALMISMDITHPNAEQFIDAKMDMTRLTGANISLKVYDDWLRDALGVDGHELDKEKARLWQKLVHNNWKSAEPGCLFWDTVLRESVPDCYAGFGFKTISTNPCGEIPLCHLDSCRLMLLNLYGYVRNPFTKDAEFDFKLLADHSRKITKLMDNMIDLELEKIDAILEKIDRDPESEDTKNIERKLWAGIREMCVKGRRAGIGTTAVADAIAAMGMRYGTPEASKFAQEVERVICMNVYIESCDLVQRDHRPAFQVYDHELEKNNPFLNRLLEGDDEYAEEFRRKWDKGRRNIALLTNAPAGSVSILTQTSSGIDPLFSAVYERKRKIDKNSGLKPDFVDKVGDWFQTYLVVHPKFASWYAVRENVSYDEAMGRLSAMSKADFDVLFEESPWHKATAADTDWIEKVRMQGMMQKYVDHSISTTVNLPKGTTEETVRQVYETAWRSGCKGCTIYVDGSRDGVLNSVKMEEKAQKHAHSLVNDAPKRPKTLPARVLRFNNNYEKWVAVIGLYENEPYEIFTGLLDKLDIPADVDSGFVTKNKYQTVVTDEDTGEETQVTKSRYDFVYKDENGDEVVVEGLSTMFRPEYWNYAKLISGLLRHGMPIPSLIKYVGSLNLDGSHINTWKNGLVRCLRKFMKEEEATGEKCPECGGEIVREGGCYVCKNCGYSKCQ